MSMQLEICAVNLQLSVYSFVIFPELYKSITTKLLAERDENTC